MFNKSRGKNNGHKEIMKGVTVEQAEQMISELTEEEAEWVLENSNVTAKELKEIIKHDPRRK